MSIIVPSDNVFKKKYFQRLYKELDTKDTPEITTENKKDIDAYNAKWNQKRDEVNTGNEVNTDNEVNKDLSMQDKWNSMETYELDSISKKVITNSKLTMTFSKVTFDDKRFTSEVTFFLHFLSVLTSIKKYMEMSRDELYSNKQGIPRFLPEEEEAKNIIDGMTILSKIDVLNVFFEIIHVLAWNVILLPVSASMYIYSKIRKMDFKKGSTDPFLTRLNNSYAVFKNDGGFGLKYILWEKTGLKNIELKNIGQTIQKTDKLFNQIENKINEKIENVLDYVKQCNRENVANRAKNVAFDTFKAIQVGVTNTGQGVLYLGIGLVSGISYAAKSIVSFANSIGSVPGAIYNNEYGKTAYAFFKTRNKYLLKKYTYLLFYDKNMQMYKDNALDAIVLRDKKEKNTDMEEYQKSGLIGKGLSNTYSFIIDTLFIPYSMFFKFYVKNKGLTYYSIAVFFVGMLASAAFPPLIFAFAITGKVAHIIVAPGVKEPLVVLDNNKDELNRYIAFYTSQLKYKHEIVSFTNTAKGINKLIQKINSIGFEIEVRQTIPSNAGLITNTEENAGLITNTGTEGTGTGTENKNISSVKDLLPKTPNVKSGGTRKKHHRNISRKLLRKRRKQFTKRAHLTNTRKIRS